MLTQWWVNVQCRDIYHCPSCNLCRVGKGLGIDFFHCMTCNSCMAMQLKEHKCMEKGLESNCPICNDFLFTSNTPVKELPCGHFMHSACFKVRILPTVLQGHRHNICLLYRNLICIVNLQHRVCFTLPCVEVLISNW